MKNKFIKILGTAFFVFILLNVMPVSAYSDGYLKGSSQTLSSNTGQGDPTFEPDWYHKPTSYAQLVSWYQTLEATYPNYIEVFKANQLYGTGTATGGYDLYYVRITNESLGLLKPEVLFLGGPHGDETVGTISMYWFTDWLMRKAFTDEPSPDYSKDYLQWLIDNREIYLEVSHNPYGFDHGPERYDGNGWDLNREADYDGPGSPTGGIFASVNGKTLREFIDNHQIRIGSDFHGGARMLLYPWASNHQNITGTSPITGMTFSYAPPDFNFFDASSLRLGAYIGDYGGDLNKYNIGTIPDTVGYEAPGSIAAWAYGGDTFTNPTEDPYVVYGPYPGAEVMWVSPEMSDIKNPTETSFGNDTVARYGAEIRRFILHQADLAQPYVRWQPDSYSQDYTVYTGTPIDLNWQVNGSVVVDHTYVQWGTNPDPINYWEYNTTDHDEHNGDYVGGTGWDNAVDGHTNGITYSESFSIDIPGEYYLVARAQVDQIYKNVLRPDVYHNKPFLRLLKERTDDSYHEVLEGTDGTEEIFGQTWWYSPVIHVTVISNNSQPPQKPAKPSGPAKGVPGTTYTYTTSTTDVDSNQIYYMWDWGDGTTSGWLGPNASGEQVSAQKYWFTKGTYNIRVKAKDNTNAESPWSDPLSVTMPRDRAVVGSFLQKILERFPNAFPILRLLISI